MYWIDILSRLQLVSFFFFMAGAVSVIPIIVVFLNGDSFVNRSLTKMMLISICLFTISALVAFFAPSAEYIEYLKNNACINN